MSAPTSQIQNPEAALKCALEHGDVNLALMALSCGAKATLQDALQVIGSQAADTETLLRILIHSGVNPYEGTPSLIESATEQQQHALAWVAMAAWSDYRNLNLPPPKAA